MTPCLTPPSFLSSASFMFPHLSSTHRTPSCLSNHSLTLALPSAWDALPPDLGHSILIQVSGRMSPPQEAPCDNPSLRRLASLPLCSHHLLHLLQSFYQSVMLFYLHIGCLNFMFSLLQHNFHEDRSYSCMSPPRTMPGI